MSPFQIEILLHYYHSIDDHSRLDTNAGRDALSLFLDVGLLGVDYEEHGGRKYRLTDCGRTFVEKLCNTPIYPLGGAA